MMYGTLRQKELSEQKIKEIKKLAYDGYCPFSVEQVLGE